MAPQEVAVTSRTSRDPTRCSSPGTCVRSSSRALRDGLSTVMSRRERAACVLAQIVLQSMVPFVVTPHTSVWLTLTPMNEPVGAPLVAPQQVIVPSVFTPHVA